jgi:signal transduction histidine kinase
VLGGTRYLAAVFTDISHRKQLEREMLQMATQVQHRVGGDLHEGLGQQLSGIAMMLNGLRQRASDVAPALCGQLDEVVALLNGAVSRTRLLARGLSPVRPSAEGLTEGFEELVNNVHEVYGQRVRLTMDLPPELSVDENSVMNLFHIAQEAVENAARHSAASDIAVSFRATGSELELQVVDDGVGFEPTQVSRERLGMGLRMMRFRAEMARGYLSIESRPGHGARLRCRCPARTDGRE